MLDLPRIRKGIRGSLTHAEKVKAAFAGVAFAVGISLAGVSGGEARAHATASTSTGLQTHGEGAMLLRPSGEASTVFAAHHSHKSHYSHRSHHSHYSSRR